MLRMISELKMVVMGLNLNVGYNKIWYQSINERGKRNFENFSM
jgi:hypothetical protein